MRRDSRLVTWLALALAPAPACSFLFDPGQYATVDAATSEPVDAWSASDVDARMPELPDAFVPPGVDADLDAAEPPDAFTAVDAGGPRCPGSTSLELPGCLVRGNGLAYCDPATGATRVLSSTLASQVLPGLRHELGLLGNGVQVAEAGERDIVDFELAREGSRLVAVWLDESTAEVRRLEYTVGGAGLTAGSLERASFGVGTSTGTDLSVRPGHVDEIVVGYVDSGTPMYGRCGAPAFAGSGCVAETSLGGGSGVARVLVAHADDAVMGAYTGTQMGTGTVGFFTERLAPGPTPTNFFPLPDPFHELRSTSGAFVYTAGATDGSDRAIYAETAASRGLGNDMPRLTRNGDLNDYRLSRARVGGTFAVEIDSAFVSSDASGALDCGSGVVCSTHGFGALERRVANTFPELRDWSYDIVGDNYRVATLLVGDGDGTNVAVAMWHVGFGAGETLEPIVVGTGRVTPPPVGNGRAIRTVVERDASSLEVFVLALVTHGEGAAARDRLFLSGFRLRACGG